MIPTDEQIEAAAAALHEMTKDAGSVREPWVECHWVYRFNRRSKMRFALEASAAAAPEDREEAGAAAYHRITCNTRDNNVQPWDTLSASYRHNRRREMRVALAAAAGVGA